MKTLEELKTSYAKAKTELGRRRVFGKAMSVLSKEELNEFIKFQIKFPLSPFEKRTDEKS